MAKPDFFAKSVAVKKSVADVVEMTAPDYELVRLPIAKIDPDPNQPRREWNEGELESLTDSVIATKGCRQPIRVRIHPDNPDRFMVVDGEGRWTAHCRGLEQGEIALTDINALIGRKDMVQPSDVRLEQTIANMARYKMHYLDEAASVYLLVNDPDAPIKKGVLAKSLGVTGSHISRLLKLHTAGELVHEAANYTKSLNLLTALADLQKFFSASEFAKLVSQVKSGALNEKKAQKLLADYNAGKQPGIAEEGSLNPLEQHDLFSPDGENDVVAGNEKTVAGDDTDLTLSGDDNAVAGTASDDEEITIDDFYKDIEPSAEREEQPVGGTPLLTAKAVIRKSGMVTLDCGSHMVWLTEDVLKELREGE